MSPGRWMAIAMLVTLPVAVTAQEKLRAADPTDPAATAAPYRYESVFSRYQSLPDTEEAPEEVWRAANEEMGKLGGHVGHVKAPTGTLRSDAAPALPQHEGASSSGHAHTGMDHKNRGK